MAESETDSGEPIHRVDFPYVEEKLAEPRQQPSTPARRLLPRHDPRNEAWNLELSRQMTSERQQSGEASGARASGSEEAPQRRERRKKRRRAEALETSPGPSSENAGPEIPQDQPLPAPKRARRPIPADWKPPLAVGASLGDNLSRLEKAERLVLQWEAILENARKTQPRADLSSFERQVEKVKRERDRLEETEENLTPS